MKPLHNYVLIKVDSTETTTPGGLIIPDSEKETPTTGTVVAVGDKADKMLEPGVKVMFEPYAGTSLTIEGEEHLLMVDTLIHGLV